MELKINRMVGQKGNVWEIFGEVVREDDSSVMIVRSYAKSTVT
jgi:hypothetical protein